MKPDWRLMAFQLGQLGFTLAFSLIGGLLLGLWVDQNLGTVPVFTLFGSLLGITAGSLATYRIIADAITKAGNPGHLAGTTHQSIDDNELNNSEDAR